YVVPDSDPLRRVPGEIDRRSVATDVVIRWNDHCVSGNPDSIADVNAAVSVDDRKRINAAIIPYTNVAAVGEKHRHRMDLAVPTYSDRSSAAHPKGAAR